MRKLYIEDCLDSRERLESILIPEFEKKLKDNIYYTFYKEYNLKIIELETRSEMFYIFNHLVSISADGWMISRVQGSDGLIMPLLKVLTRDYGLEEVIRAHKQVLEAVKEIIDDKTYTIFYDNPLVDEYYDKLDLLFILKKKLEESSGWAVYWGENPANYDLNLHIPLHDVTLTIPNENLDEMQLETKKIFLPYSYDKDNMSLLESYFKENELIAQLKNFQLRDVFSSDLLSGEEVFKSYLNKNARSFLYNYNGYISELPDKFRQANSSVDFYEIMLSSGIFSLPMNFLDSPTESKWKENHTSVIKTESGIYYLKDDNETIGYQTLKETYGV